MLFLIYNHLMAHLDSEDEVQMFLLWLSHSLVGSLPTSPSRALTVLSLLDSATLPFPLKGCVSACAYAHPAYPILFFHYYFFLYACSDFHIELEGLRCLTHRRHLITWVLKDWLTDWMSEWTNEKEGLWLPFSLGNQTKTKTKALSSRTLTLCPHLNFFIQWQPLKRTIYAQLPLFIYYYSLTLYNLAFVLIMLLKLLLSLRMYPFCHIQWLYLLYSP